jgi:non-homologous end joining protein Ku
LRFPEDLLDRPEAPPAKLDARELKLAEQLIGGLADSWKPSR